MTWTLASGGGGGAGGGGSGSGGAGGQSAPDGIWERDYDSACPQGTIVNWTLFTWQATTPGDSRIVFWAHTADDLPGLEDAARVMLATAKNQGGNTAVVTVFDALPGNRSKRWLRITADLFRSTDGTKVPVLGKTSVQFDCLPAP